MKKLAVMLLLACGCAAAPGSAFASADALPAPSGIEGGWSDFASREGSDIGFVDALTAITDKASRDLFGTPVDREALRRWIRDVAWKVRSQIVDGGARETAEAFRHAFFTVEGFSADLDFAARAEPATTVLSSVIQNKNGMCLSLSLLYLAVADEADLPVYGVSVPTHFFVRYQSGKDRLNYETLDRGGTARSDSFYYKKFFVRKGEPFYMRNLTFKDSLAVYLSQLAALYTRAGKPEGALELLDAALKASPNDPEIRTNRGVVLWALGRKAEAIDSWRSAIVLDPYDDNAHFNLAAGLSDREQWLEAIYHFDEAMRLGHGYDLKLLRKLEPHRPDALYARAPRGEKAAS